METTTIETTEIVQLVETSGLEKTKAEQIKSIFDPFLAGIDSIEKDMAKVDADNPSELDMQIAGTIRKKLVKNRTAAEAVKKAGKEMILVEGRLYDNIYGVIANTSKLLEEKLANIEKHRENKIKAEIAALQAERTELLKAITDPTPYTNLGLMPETDFNNLFNGLKLAKEAAAKEVERLEAERIEKERLEAEHKQQQAIEMERLRKENEAKEKQLQAEREENTRKEFEAADLLRKEREAAELERQKAEAENARINAEREEKIRVEREAIQKEQDRLQAENEAKLKREREAKEALEQEIADSKALEEKQHLIEEKEKRKALNANDATKLTAFIKSLDTLPRPELKGQDAKDVLQQIELLITKINVFATEKIKGL